MDALAFYGKATGWALVDTGETLNAFVLVNDLYLVALQFVTSDGTYVNASPTARALVNFNVNFNHFYTSSYEFHQVLLCRDELLFLNWAL